jgi:hypothetical protein
MSADHEPRVPDITLERYRLGELPREDERAIREQLARSAEVRGRLDDLERSEAGLAPALRGLAARLPSAAPHRRSTAVWLLPVSIAAMTALAIALAPRSTRSDHDDRVKGLRPSLALYRRTAEGSEALADGAVAHRGDLIRVGYRAAGHEYGIIASIDGRGVVTMHLPPHGDRAAPLRPGATVLLDQAYELDDAPMWERFYFVTGDAPFPVAPVIDAIRRPGALPKGLEQSVFSLQKEATP